MCEKCKKMLNCEGQREAHKRQRYCKDLKGTRGYPVSDVFSSFALLDFCTSELLHFRYYASTIGRFMKPDNVTGSPLNPQNWNLYSYVRGNPVNMNDPTGHSAASAALSLLMSSAGYPNSNAPGDPQTGGDEARQQHESKDTPPKNVGDETNVEQKLTATIFSEMRGYECPEIPDAIANVVVNRAQNRPGETLSEKVEKEISNSSTYQGVGGKSYNAALKGEKGLKELSKSGKVASSDLKSYQLAKDSAQKSLSGKLKDTTGGATHFYSQLPGGKDPYWVNQSLPTVSIACGTGAWWVFTSDN